MLRGMKVHYGLKLEGENAQCNGFLLDICKPLYQNEMIQYGVSLKTSFLSREQVLLFGKLHIVSLGLIE